MAERLGITVIPSYIIFGSEAYRDGVDLTKQQFYDKLATSRVIPTTATPPIAAYEETYRRLAEDTSEILSIQLAANLSTLHSTAAVAARNVSSAAGVRIDVVDSGQVTMGYGWMAVAAAQAAQHGQTLDQIISMVEGMKPRSRILAVLDTLEYVYRGGRVGWAQALIGTLLRVKPIIEVRLGAVNLIARTRTMDRSLDHLVGLIRELGPVERATVVHANAEAWAEQLARRLQAACPEERWI
jgi:DegV family protein with EDD domain